MTPHIHNPSAALGEILPDPGQTGAGKAVQVEAMFDRIAGTYDRLNRWISMGFHTRWKRRACGLLGLQPGSRVLDVCTGTGDLAGILLERVGEAGFVEGLDFSENMLAIARERFADHPNVRFTRGDALALPYPDHAFDAAIISFGLRNVTDIPRALAEMYRVIRPGGRMVNLDTCPTPRLPGMRFYFSRVVPKIGGLLAGDLAAYHYLSESTRCFLTPDSLRNAFEAAGCVGVTSETLMLGAVSLQIGQKTDQEPSP